MRYASGAAFRAALDQRRKTEAARRGVRLGRLRKRVAFELFLRRLIAVAPGRWVLKGAFALDLRLGARTRPTKDIDLGRDDSTEAPTEDIVAAQQLDLGDYLSFAARRTEAFADTDEFAAIRFNVRAELRRANVRAVHRRHRLCRPDHLAAGHDRDVGPARVR